MPHSNYMKCGCNDTFPILNYSFLPSSSVMDSAQFFRFSRDFPGESFTDRTQQKKIRFFIMVRSGGTSMLRSGKINSYLPRIF